MSLKRKLKALLALKRLQDLIEFTEEEEELERRSRKKNRNLVYVYGKPSRIVNKQLDSLEAKLLDGILWDGDEQNNFRRMNIDDFEHILAVVHSKITKKDTVMRAAISSRIRLALTLRFLGTGDQHKSLGVISDISRKTVGGIILQVMEAICDTLQNEHLKLPSNEDEWKAVSAEFNTFWGFPHTLGAIGGKHIKTKWRQNLKSRNYKGIPSMSLLGVIDANCKFLYIDVGGNAEFADGDIFENSSFNESLQYDMLNIPADEYLPGQEAKTSYFFIGDDIFALDDHLIKAYDKSVLSKSQKFFNNKLSQALTPIELTFHRLATRFKVLHRQLEMEVSSCKLLLKTCCILHNCLTTNSRIGLNLLKQSNTTTLPETIMPLLVQQHETDVFGNEMRDNVKKYFAGDCN